MTSLARAACALACLILAGCSAGPGHVRDRFSLGLSLFSVPLVSVVEYRHEAMSDAAAAAGDRISTESGPSPFSFLGLGRGVHLLAVEPQAKSEASEVAPDPAHQPDPRARR